jgi:hypothetical protein
MLGNCLPLGSSADKPMSMATNFMVGRLHRLGDRLGIAEVVLLSVQIWSHVFRSHQPGVVTECVQRPISGSGWAKML